MCLWKRRKEQLFLTYDTWDVYIQKSYIFCHAFKAWIISYIIGSITSFIDMIVGLCCLCVWKMLNTIGFFFSKFYFEGRFIWLVVSWFHRDTGEFLLMITKCTLYWSFKSHCFKLSSMKQNILNRRVASFDQSVLVTYVWQTARHEGFASRVVYDDRSCVSLNDS